MYDKSHKISIFSFAAMYFRSVEYCMLSDHYSISISAIVCFINCLLYTNIIIASSQFLSILSVYHSMVRWMCGVKLKDRRLPSKELRERLGVDDSIDIAAEQAALVWACAAKRWRWLGEEMYGAWSWGSKTKGETEEDLERGCSRGLSST